MKKIILIISIISLTACTHYKTSDPSLLAGNPPYKKIDMETYPLNIDADTSCHSSSSGNLVTTRCSNKGRIYNTVSVFKERGLAAVPATENDTAPKISIKHKQINKALETTTGIFNILTLGIAPLYHYDIYTVTFEDTENNVEISKSVRISSYSSWFSLFMSNPQGLKKADIHHRSEKNLIRTVLDEANVGITTKHQD